MKIITSQDYCVKCHIVGDFNPTSSERAKAPKVAAALVSDPDILLLDEPLNGADPVQRAPSRPVKRVTSPCESSADSETEQVQINAGRCRDSRGYHAEASVGLSGESPQEPIRVPELIFTGNSQEGGCGHAA